MKMTLTVYLLIVLCACGQNNAPHNTNMPDSTDGDSTAINAETPASEDTESSSVPKPAARESEEPREATKSVPKPAKETFGDSLIQLNGDGSTKDTTVPRPEKAEYNDRVQQWNEPAFAGRHDILDGLLLKHVSTDGRVNYEAFKKDEAKLDRYLDQLSGMKTDEMGREEALAFWINVYNAFTIKLILKHYPVGSITDIENGKPWDLVWIDINGKKYSLNQVENEIIRPQFKEPRIHFAVNCAAKSCPPLMNRAWTAENLERELEARSSSFINNKAYNLIMPGKLKLSRIFEWYASDFGDLINYIQGYTVVKIKPDARIDFLEYDWALNNL